MKIPKFTILMPVVKTRYFKEAFESAITQIFNDFEIIVINNEADGDLEWVNEYSNVTLIKNKIRLLPGENWNKGVKCSNGEWIILLSDDDLLVEGALSFVNQFILEINDSVDVIRTQRETVSEDGMFLSYSCPGRVIETMPEYLYNQVCFKRGQVISDVFMKRTAIIEAGGFKDLAYAWGMDHLMVLEIASLRNKIGILNKVCMKYRMHVGNISSLPSVKSSLEKMKADNIWTSGVKKLLNCHKMDVYYEAATGALHHHRQLLQDGHYSTVVANQGLLGLFILNHSNDTNLGSKKISLMRGMSSWLGKILK